MSAQNRDSNRYHLFFFPGVSREEQAIQAESSPANGGQVKENKAEQYGSLAVVLNRPKSSGSVRHEVGKGHLSRQQESYRNGEQPDADCQTAEELQYTREPAQRQELNGVASQQSKQLSSTMLPE